MPPLNTGVQPRRFAKACDACHRSKIRCNRIANSPLNSCANCIRRNARCTSTIATRRPAKSSRTSGHLDDATERCSESEAHTAGSDTAQSSRLSDRQLERPGQHAPVNNRGNDATLGEVLQSEQDIEVVNGYFETWNQIFPILDRHASLGRSLLQRHLVSPSDEDLMCHTAKLAIFALATRLPATGSSAKYVGTTASTYMESALSRSGDLLPARPSLECIQVLLLLALALSDCLNRNLQASALLAVASRHCQILRLHQLDYAENLSIPERLTRMRLFWCLYSLEQSVAFQVSQPPSIIETEVLVIEPREVSMDGLGLISSKDGQLTLNLFTARQRLAKVQAEIHMKLHTFKGRRSPSTVRKQNISKLKTLLLDWETRWFARGAALKCAGNWDSWALPHIVKLQFDFLACFLVMSSDESVGEGAVPSSSIAEPQQPEERGFLAAARMQNPSWKVLQTSRTMLSAIKSHVGGDCKVLMQCARLILPAILVLIQGVTYDPGAVSAKADLEETRTWLTMLQQASEARADGQSGDEVSVASKLDAVVKAWDTASRGLWSC